MSSPPPSQRAFSTLREFVRPVPSATRTTGERCELCGLMLPADHPHLLALASRNIVCSCPACSILFAGQDGARYQPIPRDAHLLPDFHMTDAQWEALSIPIGLVFFFHDSQKGKVTALYPGPAGAIETLLGLGAWPDLVGQNPVLADLQPDVEALLVNRIGTARDYYRVPIDRCFKLVGLIRTNWRGLSGGSEVWEEVQKFFAVLRGQELRGLNHA